MPETKRTLTTIHEHRHDFLNHVQVIQAMLKLGKYADLERYTSELVGEIAAANGMIQIGHPALAALIQAKLDDATKKGIRFSLEATTSRTFPFKMKSIDIVKIAGNLIDNAFEAVLGLPEGENTRSVELSIGIENGAFVLSVSNPGPVLSTLQIEQMFQPGFTTKNSHSGIGLAIVKRCVEQYGGTIDVASEEAAGITITVHIPL